MQLNISIPNLPELKQQGVAVAAARGIWIMFEEDSSMLA